MSKKYLNRVELHCHTNYSEMDGTASVRKIMNFAKEQGMTSVAFMDHGNVCAYPEIQRQSKQFDEIKPIYGLEAYVINDLKFESYNEETMKECPMYHTSILVKNKEGLKTLYKIVSDSNTKYFSKRPRILLSELLENRENLIIGSGCEAGELARGILEGKLPAEVEEVAKRYDYLEVQPISENRWMIEAECETSIESDEDIREFNNTIIRLGEKLGIPVVAISDVHYLRPENGIGRCILKSELGFLDCQNPDDLYFRTTEEMLEEFSYLGEEKAYEIVIGNSNLIAEKVERIEPLDCKKVNYSKPGDYECLEQLCFDGLVRIYGSRDNVPEAEKSRLEFELSKIKEKDSSYVFLHYYDLIHRNNLSKAQYSLRGIAAGMFISYLLELSHVNPLDAENPLYARFFLGREWDKAPDIDINIDKKVWPKVLESAKKLRGIKTTYRASLHGAPRELRVASWIEFYEEYEHVLTEEQKEIIRNDCRNVLRVKCGPHPGGMIMIPEGVDETEFSPLDMDFKREVATLQFDYHSMDSIFEKYDILGHDNCTLNARLAEQTNYYPTDEDINSEEMMSLLTSTEGLGISNGSNHGIKSGLLGIPGYNFFALNLVEKLRPKSIADSIKIEGICHGTNTWYGNGEILIEDGKATLRDLIATREDVYETMLQYGFEEETAFSIAEDVRKGRMNSALREKMVLHDVPEWYIRSCERVQYLFPRAHAAEYTQMELRSLYYKMHYPEHYYPLYPELYATDRVREAFKKRADGFDELRYEVMADKSAKLEDVYYFLVWNEARMRGAI